GCAVCAVADDCVTDVLSIPYFASLIRSVDVISGILFRQPVEHALGVTFAMLAMVVAVWAESLWRHRASFINFIQGMLNHGRQLLPFGVALLREQRTEVPKCPVDIV